MTVLTMYKDRYTSARRSSPVPQLQCVGCSAGCQTFIPEVVQCRNKGWDGVDVQVPTGFVRWWKGSEGSCPCCTLELTEEGRRRTEIIIMALMQDHHPQDSNLTSQAILVPTDVMVSTATTLADNSTQEAELRLAQAEASGLAWGQEGCWANFLVIRGFGGTKKR